MNLNCPGKSAFLMWNVIHGEDLLLIFSFLDINLQSVLRPKVLLVIPILR